MQLYDFQEEDSAVKIIALVERMPLHIRQFFRVPEQSRSSYKVTIRLELEMFENTGTHEDSIAGHYCFRASDLSPP